MLFGLVFSAAVAVTVNGVTLVCVAIRPDATVQCTCTNPTKNGVEWRIDSELVTSCSGSVNNVCFPSVSGYTSNVLTDEFYLDVNSYAKTCTTYTCKDATTLEEMSVTTAIVDECECKCKVLAIVCVVFGVLGLIIDIVLVVAYCKDLFTKKPPLVGLEIADIVLLIISIGLGAAVVGKDDCGSCDEWVEKSAIAFIVISSLGTVLAFIITVLTLVGDIPHRKNGKIF